jgi:hypothetical protein
VTVPRITAALAGALLATSAGVVACSAGDEADPSADPVVAESSTPADGSPAAEPSPAPYLDVPADVELTDQGQALSLGDSATVAWEPRKRLVGALDVTVRAVERAPISVFRGWRLTPETRSSAAYFVRARLENVGETDLTGLDVPLYAVDETNTLLQAASFASRFEPCPSTKLPEKYRPGRSATVCLVYLVPDKGDLTAVAFRPTQTFEPITWTGEETTYRTGEERPRKEREGQQGRQGQDQS